MMLLELFSARVNRVTSLLLLCFMTYLPRAFPFLPARLQMLSLSRLLYYVNEYRGLGNQIPVARLPLICIFTIHTSVLNSLRTGLLLKRGVIKKCILYMHFKGREKRCYGVGGESLYENVI